MDERKNKIIDWSDLGDVGCIGCDDCKEEGFRQGFFWGSMVVAFLTLLFYFL